MKLTVKIVVLASLFSLNAMAGGSWYPPEQQSRMIQCTIGEARAYAGVGSYFDWCDYQRKNNIGQHGNKSPLWTVTLPGNRGCYCPCDYGYEDRVRTGEESINPQYFE